jgi:hypothetical protein
MYSGLYSRLGSGVSASASTDKFDWHSKGQEIGEDNYLVINLGSGKGV